MGRDTQPLVQRLRSGGYVIVVRHGATATNQADTEPFNFNDVTKQRNLNDKGKELAKAFGDAVRRVSLPVGEVYTSKFNRAYETAVLAGFENIALIGAIAVMAIARKSVVSKNLTNSDFWVCSKR